MKGKECIGVYVVAGERIWARLSDDRYSVYTIINECGTQTAPTHVMSILGGSICCVNHRLGASSTSTDGGFHPSSSPSSSDVHACTVAVGPSQERVAIVSRVVHAGLHLARARKAGDPSAEGLVQPGAKARAVRRRAAGRIRVIHAGESLRARLEASAAASLRHADAGAVDGDVTARFLGVVHAGLSRRAIREASATATLRFTDLAELHRQHSMKSRTEAGAANHLGGGGLVPHSSAHLFAASFSHRHFCVTKGFVSISRIG